MLISHLNVGIVYSFHSVWNEMRGLDEYALKMLVFTFAQLGFSLSCHHKYCMLLVQKYIILFLFIAKRTEVYICTTYLVATCLNLLIFSIAELFYSMQVLTVTDLNNDQAFTETIGYVDSLYKVFNLVKKINIAKQSLFVSPFTKNMLTVVREGGSNSVFIEK